MKKKWLVLGMLPLLLFAFVPSSPVLAGDADLTMKITTTVNTDGSGTLDAEVSFSKAALAFLKSIYPQSFSVDSMCSSFVTGANEAIEWEQEDQPGGGTVCLSQQTFADLNELKSLTGEFILEATFERLEISGGHFYYDLVSNSENETALGPMSPITMAAYWVLKVPGEVVSTNADEVQDLTLTWDLTKVGVGSHFHAECNLGGVFDPILMTAGAVLLLCCCLVILIAGGAAFFFLRRKKSAAPQG
jgi:hypothetical protein